MTSLLRLLALKQFTLMVLLWNVIFW